MRMPGVVFFVSALVAIQSLAGCQRDRMAGPPTAPPAADAAPNADREFLEGRAVVEREARRRASRGDRSMLDTLEAVAAIAPDPGLVAGMDPSDPSTWGPASIYWTRLYVSIGDAQFIRGEMEHNGDIGYMDLSFTVTNRNGNQVAAGGPFHYSQWNFFAPLTRAKVGNTVPLRLGYECGRALNGAGTFGAFFSLLPVELRLEGASIPPLRLGEVREYETAMDAAPDCPAEEEDTGDTGDGTGGGDGDGSGSSSGSTYSISACVYLDWFRGDGTYWYTEFLGCTTLTVVNAT